jgi:hypothetical protein
MPSSCAASEMPRQFPPKHDEEVVRTTSTTSSVVPTTMVGRANRVRPIAVPVVRDRSYLRIAERHCADGIVDRRY